MTQGTIFCLGLGPGDPDLMSVRADRLLRQSKHVAYFRKEGRKGQARSIVEGMLPDDVTEFAMEYPVTTEIPFNDPEYKRILASFYESCAEHLRVLSQQGEDVMVLCEGDPFFYGSFMHLHSRLSSDVPIEIVPAITGMSAAWTATDVPITWGDDVLTVLMGTLPEEDLTDRLASSDAVVIMKIGRNIEKIRSALKKVGKYDQAWLVERASMPGQTVQMLSEVEGKITPYFSIVLIHGQGRRP